MELVVGAAFEVTRGGHDTWRPLFCTILIYTKNINFDIDIEMFPYVLLIKTSSLKSAQLLIRAITLNVLQRMTTLLVLKISPSHTSNLQPK